MNRVLSSPAPDFAALLASVVISVSNGISQGRGKGVWIRLVSFAMNITMMKDSLWNMATEKQGGFALSVYRWNEFPAPARAWNFWGLLPYSAHLFFMPSFRFGWSGDFLVWAMFFCIGPIFSIAINGPDNFSTTASAWPKLYFVYFFFFLFMVAGAFLRSSKRSIGEYPVAWNKSGFLSLIPGNALGHIKGVCPLPTRSIV